MLLGIYMGYINLIPTQCQKGKKYKILKNIFPKNGISFPDKCI